MPHRGDDQINNQILSHGYHGPDGQEKPQDRQNLHKMGRQGVLIKIIQNTYDFVNRHIDRSQAKEHIGYIVDRVGYPMFKKEVLKDVKLHAKALVAEHIELGRLLL
jgi:anaerobic sulfite reductase subunit C